MTDKMSLASAFKKNIFDIVIPKTCWLSYYMYSAVYFNMDKWKGSVRKSFGTVSQHLFSALCLKI